MTKNEKANVDVVVNGAQANQSVKEMEKNVRGLYAAWRNLTPGTKEAEAALKKYNKEAEKLANVKAHVFTTKKSMDSLGASFSGMAGKIGGVLGVLTLLKSALTAVIKNSMEEEEAQNRLTYALNGNAAAAKNLMKWKDQLKKGSTFTEDEIYSAITFGLQMGNSAEMTKKMVTAALALNKATIGLVDPQTALSQLQGTLQGDLGRLKKYTGELTTEQLRNGEAIDVLISKYGKYLNQGMDVMSGGVKTLKDNWESFTERIGMKYLPFISALIGKLNELMSMDDEEEGGILSEDNIGGWLNKFSEASVEGQKQMIANVEAQEKDYFNKWQTAITNKDEINRKVYSYWYDIAKEKHEKMLALQKGNNIPGIGDTDKLKGEADKYAKYLEGIIRKLEDTRINLIQDEREKELKMAELNYQREVAQITGFSDKENELRLALEAEYLGKRWEISEKYLEKEQKEREKIEKEALRERFAKVNQTGSGMELQEDVEERLQLEWEAEKMYMERTGQMTIDKRREIIAQERDIMLAGAASNSEAQLLIWEQYYDQLGQLNTDYIQSVTDEVATIGEVVYTATEILVQSANDRDALELKVYEKNLNKKLAALEEALNQGLITQEEYNDEVVKSEQDLAAKRYAVAKKQADRELGLALMMVAVKEGVALANAIAVSAESSSHWAELIAAVILTVAMVAEAFIEADNKINEAKAYAQFDKGRYDVIGASDGQLYKNVPYKGTAKTGIVHGPALVSEKGDELIIDGPTTKNLMMNHPGIIRAIEFARVPQYAEGKYSNIQAGSTNAVEDTGYSKELLSTLNRLDSKLDNLHAKLVWSEWESANSKITNIRNDVSMG